MSSDTIDSFEYDNDSSKHSATSTSHGEVIKYQLPAPAFREVIRYTTGVSRKHLPNTEETNANYNKAIRHPNVVTLLSSQSSKCNEQLFISKGIIIIVIAVVIIILINCQQFLL